MRARRSINSHSHSFQNGEWSEHTWCPYRSLPRQSRYITTTGRYSRTRATPVPTCNFPTLTVSRVPRRNFRFRIENKTNSRRFDRTRDGTLDTKRVRTLTWSRWIGRVVRKGGRGSHLLGRLPSEEGCGIVVKTQTETYECGGRCTVCVVGRSCDRLWQVWVRFFGVWERVRTLGISEPWVYTLHVWSTSRDDTPIRRKEARDC